jgi:hypothetical protein
MQNTQRMQEGGRLQYNLKYIPALAVIVVVMLASSTEQLLTKRDAVYIFSYLFLRFKDTQFNLS